MIMIINDIVISVHIYCWFASQEKVDWTKNVDVQDWKTMWFSK